MVINLFMFNSIKTKKSFLITLMLCLTGFSQNPTKAPNITFFWSMITHGLKRPASADGYLKPIL